MSTIVGVLIFLLLLLFAVQVLYGLYATSVVTAVTFDAARGVAGADGGRDPGARRTAEAEARSRLGRFADDVDFTWEVGDEAVHLTVVARRPGFLPRSLAAGVGMGDIRRTVRVRTEAVR